MAFQQQQQRALAELRIRFGQTFTLNHFYHREYIDFHRKTLKPLKIVLGNRTPHGRAGISAALRASCVLIVSSICRIWAPCQVGILLLIVWRGIAGGLGRARGLKLVWSSVCSAGIDLWPFQGKGQRWVRLSSVSVRVSGSFPLLSFIQPLFTPWRIISGMLSFLMS